MEPSGPLDHNVQCLIVAGMGGHVIEAHQCLVQCVVRGPHSLPSGDPVQILFRYRSNPLASVFLLAARQFGNDSVCLAFDLDISRAGVDARRRGEPVTEEVPS